MSHKMSTQLIRKILQHPTKFIPINPVRNIHGITIWTYQLKKYSANTAIKR